MGKILVFVESNKGALKRSSIELLQAAHASGNEVAALAVGSSASSLLAEVGANGAKEFHVINDGSMDNYNPELFTLSVFDVIQKVQPKILLASASALGRDLFPRIAAKIDTGIMSDCIELKFNGDSVQAKKPMYSGKCFAEGTFSNSSVQIVLMRPNQLPVVNPPGGEAQMTEHKAATVDLKTLIKDVVKGAGEKLDLSEANIVVSGGRGLKEAGHFKLLQDLADVLGATVGASRAVVDAGWVSHSMQVGQTGKTVAPSLYIAVGISGAIQHLAGMSGSKVIVAINNDPNAPIFQKSTYGIVGDLFEIIPLLTEEFKKALHA